MYYLKSIGLDPIVISLTSGDHWEKRIKELSVPVYFVGKSKIILVRLLKIILILRRNRITLIQSQHVFTNLHAYFCAKILNINHIGAVRSDILNDDFGIKFEFLRKLFLRLPEKLAQYI